MASQYSPSGRFSPLALLLFPAVLLTIVPLLSAAYAYAIWYVPIVYLNAVFALILGGLTGYAINRLVVKVGKVRNNVLAIAFAAVGAVASLYLQWAVWVDLVINAGKTYGDEHMGVTVSNIQILQVLGLALSPLDLFSIIGKISETGTWGIRGNAISGVFLIGIWVIEAGILLVLPMIMSTSQSKKPFCEMSGEWFTEEELPAKKFIESKAAFLASLDNLEVSPLSTMQDATDLGADHSLVTKYCSRTNPKCYISVINKKSKVNSKGEIEFDNETLIEYAEVKAG
ncbi:MAG: hypothetical protein IPK50_04360 [Fibrobacterota bacterium]|nr:hypothetical protein [Fibrobacterota bacterium]QQS06128.1 MAG: hypothetical protein IPK50_04360 [Fibrobacterota bacterium]